MYNAIVIAGATGVGKTDLSIKLAKELNAKIISADATQVYRKLDIGSAKISKEEMCDIDHYLIDIVDIGDDYSVGNYYKDANDILNRDKNTCFLLVGGTGLYLDSITQGLTMMPNIDKKKREKLESMELCQLVELLTDEEKAKIDICNKVRVIRKLEKRGIEYNNIKGNDRNFLKIFLIRNRSNLYDRINKRVDQMIEKGLIEEARKIYEEYGDIVKSIGYKELFEYFKGEVSLEFAIEKIKTNSRRYAKRQFTWFKNKGYHIFNLDDETEEDIIDKIRREYGN